MGAVIRLAASNEIPIVREIMLQAFEEYRGRLNPPSGALSETVEDIRKKISGEGGALLVELDGISVASAQFYYKDDHVQLSRISVLPAYRGYGYGKLMVRHVENLAREAGVREARLGVRGSLPGNLDFYRKLNYEVIERHDYPDETDYWCVMSHRWGDGSE